MVDIHSHILPGLDDGPATLEGAVEMARAAERAGLRTLVATPHIRDDYPFPLELIGERLAEVRTAISEAGVDLELLSGGEVAVSKVGQLDDATLAGLCLGEGNYLLVESPHTQAPALLESVLFDLQLRGFRPVLAHPERSLSFLHDRIRLERLVERGIVCSVTALSMTGAFGARVQTFTARLFQEGLVHNVASDAHDAVRRVPGFAGAFRALELSLEGASAGEDWFTTEVGAAILEGRELPDGPPELRIRPTGWRRLRDRVGLL